MNMRLNKKIIVLLSLLLSMILISCSANKKEIVTINNKNVEISPQIRIGQLSFNAADESDFDIVLDEASGKYQILQIENTNNNNIKNVYYENLTSMLMGLSRGEVYGIRVLKCQADYITNFNKKFVIDSDVNTIGVTGISMLLKDTDAELCDAISTQINNINADGTMKKLQDEYIKKANVDNAAQIESFDGAKTIKVAITGDIPPVDYILENGTPSGFNVALISEIAKRLKVNVELVPIESGARAMALATGRADVIFWNRSVLSEEEFREMTNEEYKDAEWFMNAFVDPNGNPDINKLKYNNELNDLDQPSGTVATIPFFKSPVVLVVKQK